MADAMPAPDAGESDPLRTVVGLSGEQLDAVCQVVAAATAAELRLQVGTLKEAFRQMDQARHEALNGGAKFQVHKASAGNIDDFHGGLGGSVGELIKFVMVCVLYSEHFLDPEVETACFMN